MVEPLYKGWKPPYRSFATKKPQPKLRLLVLEMGLEPIRPNGHKILSLACLPIPPLEQQFFAR